MKKILDEAERALTEAVFSLTPSPHEPSEDIEKELITFDREETDNSKWKALLAEHLETAKTFEIHCWNEETEWIELALQYGNLKESDWQHGKIIAGNITPEFASMLLDFPKPTDTEIYNKMTPFFNVFLDNGFSSSHYGTEVYIWGGTRYERKAKKRFSKSNRCMYRRKHFNLADTYGFPACIR